MPATFTANNSIQICSFVKLDTSSNDRVIQATSASDKVIGIASVYPNEPPIPLNSSPTVAAIAGQGIAVYQPGECTILTAGSQGWTSGDLLVAGANGAAYTATTGNHYGARALATVTAGSKGFVRVECGTL
jgi:hypothetical protein